MWKVAGRWRVWSRSLVVGAVVLGGVLSGNAWRSWDGSGDAADHSAAHASAATAASAATPPGERAKSWTVPPQSAFPTPFNDPDSCVIDEKSGVPLCWKADAKLFPDYWLTKEIGARASNLALRERKRALRLVTFALRRYPPVMLHAHLNAIYLVGSLRFSGISAGGTNSLDRVYMHDEGVKKGYTDAFLTRTFHHEFSSVLLRLRSDLWDDTAWRACNAPGFRYGTNGTEAVREQKASCKPDAKLMALGCLNQYATASPEEDFNEMVEVVMCATPRERANFARFPRLERKAQLVRAFYTKLGMRFD